MSRLKFCAPLVFCVACTGSISGAGGTTPNLNIGGAGGTKGNPADFACDPKEVGFAAIKPLSGRQYANTLREVFRGAAIPEALFPDAGDRTALELSARTLETVDSDARRLLTAALKNATTWLGCDLQVDASSQCRDKLINNIGLRIFRRPLAVAEAKELSDLFDNLRSDGLSVMETASVVVRAMLQAPEFLFHLELGPANADVSTDATFALSDYALASRLSYFLWQSMPDPELMSAAAEGRLADQKGLATQVQRLLADERAQESLTDWFERLLGIDDIGKLTKNSEAYPSFNGKLRDEMRDETRRFFRSVLGEEDGHLQKLFDADYTIATPAVAAIYGATHPGSGPQRIAVNPQQRSGVLTHPSVLAMHGATFGSHPVKRGMMVLTHLLCQTVPPPPAEVDTTIKPDSYEPGATTRTVFSAHTKSSSCVACHKAIDPIGFGFEHYDGIGQYREKDGVHPVDASGELKDTDVDGPFVGAVQLSKRLAGSKQVAACVATKMFEAAHNRLSTPQDDCRLKALGAWFAGGPRTLPELVTKVLADSSLRYRLYDEKP